jgi:hypothetical protein
MPRPNRLYTIDGKYYYIKDGKKVFVKVPAGVTQKQVSKINIKNIIKLAESKRVVRKKKRRNLAYQKKIAPVLQKSETSGLPIYFFKPQKKIPTIQEIADSADDTNIEKLTKLLLKDSKLVPSSSKLPTEPTIATPSFGSRFKKLFTPKKELTAAEKSQEAYEKAMAERERIKAEREAERSSRVETPKTMPSPAAAFEEPKRKANVAGVATRIRKFFGREERTPSKQEIETPSSTIETGTFERAKKNVRDERGIAVGRTLSFDTIPEEQGGEGYGSSDGLYEDEIETIAKKRLKDFVPVIAKDETNELMKYVKRADKQFGFVINTDNSDQPGRHWRAVYINNMDDYPSIEYFDPLVEGKPEQSLIDISRKIAIKMNPSKLFKYKQNMLRRQSKLTSNCGYHVIQFLEGRYKGIPFSEVTGYEKFIEDMKKQHGELDGSGHGEKEIKPLMKAYDSYI